MGYLDDNAVTIESVHRTQRVGGKGLGRVRYLYRVTKASDNSTSYIASTRVYRHGEIILNANLVHLEADVWDGSQVDENGDPILPSGVSVGSGVNYGGFPSES